MVSRRLLTVSSPRSTTISCVANMTFIPAPETYFNSDKFRVISPSLRSPYLMGVFHPRRGLGVQPTGHVHHLPSSLVCFSHFHFSSPCSLIKRSTTCYGTPPRTTRSEPRAPRGSLSPMSPSFMKRILSALRIVKSLWAMMKWSCLPSLILWRRQRTLRSTLAHLLLTRYNKGH